MTEPGDSRPMTPGETPAGMLSDEEIVRRVLEGEKELYELILRRYNPRLFRVARTYVNDPDDAEDVVQQAHINAYEHLRSFEGRSKFSTWLTRIAINEAMLRSRVRLRSVPLEPERLQSARDENPAEKAMHEELKKELERTIDALPLPYRSVFVMRAVEGMSVAETGAALGISIANVKVRLNRARAMLRERIGEEYRELPVYDFDLVRCDRIVAAVLTRVHRYEGAAAQTES
jgi:RNA polymerase sigma factor (sigma-70 family)